MVDDILVYLRLWARFPYWWGDVPYFLWLQVRGSQADCEEMEEGTAKYWGVLPRSAERRILRPG